MPGSARRPIPADRRCCCRACGRASWCKSAAAWRPAGSTLVIRATGIHLDVVANGGLTEAATGAQSVSNKGTEERRFVINDAGAATVRSAASRDNDVAVHRHPGKPPTIALAMDPEGQARGVLQLNYKLGRLRRGRAQAPSGCRVAKALVWAPTASRRARCSMRPISRWCCRRRAPRTASGRPPRT
jgi:hypothetical protein